MAIGSNFEAAMLKGIRSLEIGKYSLIHKQSESRSLDELKSRVIVPDDERIFDLAEMIRRGYKTDKVSEITGVDKWFINKIKWIVDEEEKLRKSKIEDLSKEYLYELKKRGFSDKGIADLMKISPERIYELRKLYNINPIYKMVDTCSGEFVSNTPYYYSCYDEEDESIVSDNKKIVVIGSGPIRIGQGIEFDYCCVHGAWSIKDLGYESIIINNNPETVSTDFDTADKLYFDPLYIDDVMNVINKENPEGVIVQFGGQTSINLAKKIYEKGVNILGTSFKSIDLAEDREKFGKLLKELDIPMPSGEAVTNLKDALKVANNLKYPVIVRPSYVIGGRAMQVVYFS